MVQLGTKATFIIRDDFDGTTLLFWLLGQFGMQLQESGLQGAVDLGVAVEAMQDAILEVVGRVPTKNDAISVVELRICIKHILVTHLNLTHHITQHTS